MCDINSRLLGYENLEVVNPEGGKDDAEEEAHRGRWKQEVCVSIFLSFSARSAIFPEFDFFYPHCYVQSICSKSIGFGVLSETL